MCDDAVLSDHRAAHVSGTDAGRVPEYLPPYAVPNAVEYLSLPDALAGTDMATCSGYLRFTSGPIKSLDCFGTFAGGVHNSPGVYVRNLQNLNQFLSFHLNLQPYAEAKDLNSGNFN